MNDSLRFYIYSFVCWCSGPRIALQLRNEPPSQDIILHERSLLLCQVIGGCLNVLLPQRPNAQIAVVGRENSLLHPVLCQNIVAGGARVSVAEAVALSVRLENEYCGILEEGGIRDLHHGMDLGMDDFLLVFLAGIVSVVPTNAQNLVVLVKKYRSVLQRGFKQSEGDKILVNRKATYCRRFAPVPFRPSSKSHLCPLLVTQQGTLVREIYYPTNVGGGKRDSRWKMRGRKKIIFS